MSAFDYGRAQNTADRMLTRFGQTVRILRPVKSSGEDYDPTIGTPTRYDAAGAVMTYRNAEIDGTRVLAGDKKVLVSAKGLGITPATSDKLSIGGVSHAIVDVMPFAPAGTVVYFEIQARK